MKSLVKITPFRLSLLITGWAVISYIAGFSFFETMELKSLDFRFNTRGEIKPGPEVAIVTIDEKSLDNLGRWPWPRKKIADLIDALSDYGVNSVGFDVVFAEPDHNSESIAINEIKSKIDSLEINNKKLISYLDKKAREEDNDALLADAIKRSGRVVLGYFFHTSDEDLKHLGEAKIEEDEYLKKSAYSSVRYLSKEATNTDFTTAVFSLESNLPRFSREAAGFGYFNVFPDFDGTIRWVPLLLKYGNDYFPPLSLQLARKYLGDKQLTIVAAEYGVESVMLGDIEIPTNEGGGLLINYRGGNKTFPHYSVYDVINKKIPKEALEDKIILIGATAIGIYDMRVAPFSNVFPGVEVHANVIDNILHQDFLFRPGWVGAIDILIIIAAGFILGGLLPRLGPVAGAFAALAILTSFTAGNLFLFTDKGIWLNFVYPSISILTIYTSITLLRYMTEEKEKKKVRNAFQYYMTSSVVNEVLKDSDKLKLGGEKKVLSVLFSDIRGFTNISEQMTPEMLVHFLNEYLTVMTDIVFDHDGVLDKYMGDAIMAMYGAPLEQKDHPVRACKTALDMMKALKHLHKSWEKQGLPKIDIGLGISTGPMVVGNMGSERRFDYTVMGDTVNLGSRLEAINKMYGTNIIISEGTYSAVRDFFICRELDAVRVKGKDRPVKIYELMAEAGSDERYLELSRRFEAALDLYRTMKWQEAISAFQEIFKIRPKDPASEMYIKRCHALAKAPPAADWDGVFTMTTK
ncbi:MAG: adenylate/guanylate cyclase domain-containing protein [bacterium]|nr:adenylate/guanylate cyclase domain-containing protein [bacterium]